MATLRIATPVPGYSGSVGGVHFANGEALVDDETHAAEVGYFRAAGYVVEELERADDSAPVKKAAGSAAKTKETNS